MLSRPGPLPCGSGWSFELKWDGFRALVSTEDGQRVRTRRGCDRSAARATRPARRSRARRRTRGLEEGPAVLPADLWRVLNRDMSVRLTYVIFDVLRRDGEDLTGKPTSHAG
jgi:bifunctional non-homologous end joining protein LigD